MNICSFIFTFFVFFSSLSAMENHLKGILKKGGEKKRLKKVHFKDPLASYDGDGWLPKLVFELYNGTSCKQLQEQGFDKDLITKAQDFASQVDASLVFLMSCPLLLDCDLEKEGFQQIPIQVARTVFNNIFDLARHCLIAEEKPECLQKEGYSQKMIQKVAKTVDQVHQIRLTNKIDGFSLKVIMLAQELDYLNSDKKKQKTHKKVKEKESLKSRFLRDSLFFTGVLASGVTTLLMWQYFKK